MSNPRARAARAPCMEKIYENPRARAARALCIGSLPVKSSVAAVMKMDVLARKQPGELQECIQK